MPAPSSTPTSADVIIVGAAGLAGLTAAAELSDAGRRVIIVDEEPQSSLGGQAPGSFGGLFLVDTPEQRRIPDWIASHPHMRVAAGNIAQRPATRS
ncbi:MAG: FAD-binding protein [Microbacterium sp.]